MKSPLRDRLFRSTKRAIDIAVSAAGLTAFSAPLIGIAIAIKLDSGGHVFYRGVRAGRDGRPFKIFKFRSMKEVSGGPDTTSVHDDRITRVGHFIRKYKLDELPQLINVLKGDMSLVGPRPEVLWCVEMYNDDEKKILTVRPGITDWSSIRFHNEGEIIAQSGYDDADEAYLKLIRPEKLRLQLKYVEEQSLKTDVQILYSTLATLVRTRALDS